MFIIQIFVLLIGDIVFFPYGYNFKIFKNIFKQRSYLVIFSSKAMIISYMLESFFYLKEVLSNYVLHYYISFIYSGLCLRCTIFTLVLHIVIFPLCFFFLNLPFFNTLFFSSAFYLCVLFLCILSSNSPISFSTVSTLS